MPNISTKIVNDDQHIRTIEEIAEFIRSSPTLRSIDLSGHRIDAAGARNLAEALNENRNLTSINLANNQLGDEGIKIIMECLLNRESTIKKINIANNNITFLGVFTIADALKNNINLTEIIGYHKNFAASKCIEQQLKHNLFIETAGKKPSATPASPNERDAAIKKYLRFFNELPVIAEVNPNEARDLKTNFLLVADSP